MKTFITKETKLTLVFALAFLLMSISTKADALWVGQPKTCEATIMGIFQTNVSWNVSGGYISLTGNTWATKTATITQYYSGTATITCSYQYKLYSTDQLRPFTQTWSITCNDNPLSIYPITMALEPGQSEYITPHLQFTNSYNQYAQYTFTSIDPSVATVNSSGRVTAVGEGISNIIVQSTASANSCTCIVHVAQSPNSVSLPDSLYVEIGESVSLTPVVSPSGATATFTWHTSDASVVSVSANGLLSGVGHGTAVVNCMTQNGVTSNDCVVAVDYRTPCGISITEDTCFLLVGETHQLVCDVFPVGSNPAVSWHSCDESIAPINSSGLIAGYHLGATMIIATTSNGLQDTCYVKVCQEAAAVQLREGVSIALGARYVYRPLFVPQDSYANDLQWESEDESIVTVDDGAIVAVGMGSTLVKVYNNSGLYAESIVYVKEMNQINVWMKTGMRYSYPIDYLPKITYTPEGKVFIEAWYLTASYEIAEVSKITLADESEPWLEPQEPATGITENDFFLVKMSVFNNQIVFNNLMPQSVVSVYSINGCLVNDYRANFDGSLRIDMNTYHTGIYIINTNNQSFKIFIP